MDPPYPPWPYPAGPFAGAAMLDQEGQAVNWVGAPVPWWLWSASAPPQEHNDYLPVGLQHPYGRDARTPDELGVRPPWAPDSRRPWKQGQPKAAFIWPRDKHTNKPLSSWTRWKDVATGRGPPIYIGNRTRFGPSKDQWSRWLEFDNFGYRTGELHLTQPPTNQKYDFHARKFTTKPWRAGVWSGVQRNRHSKDVPNMLRDAWGTEWTYDQGWLPRELKVYNKYRYDESSPSWDYFAPELVVG